MTLIITGLGRVWGMGNGVKIKDLAKNIGNLPIPYFLTPTPIELGRLVFRDYQVLWRSNQQYFQALVAPFVVERD